MIIAVSDVHLGYDKCNLNDFLRFLNECDSAGIDHLILLGDILDFWRKNNAEVVTEKKNAEILAKLAKLNVKNIHYVVGNHDYYLYVVYKIVKYMKSYDKIRQLFSLQRNALRHCAVIVMNSSFLEKSKMFALKK